jgi:hypothetical protein
MLCIVAATGASLTPEIAEQCKGRWVIAVNDAYRLIPDAQTLYAADIDWWIHHKGCPDFKGEKLTCLLERRDRRRDRIVEQYGLATIPGKRGATFSLKKHINFGSNSAFQAANVALLRGASPLIFVGLDLHGPHFFGEHPKGLARRRTSYDTFIGRFANARSANPELPIIKATPGSSLGCFPIMTLREALDASGET